MNLDFCNLVFSFFLSFLTTLYFLSMQFSTFTFFKYYVCYNPNPPHLTKVIHYNKVNPSHIAANSCCLLPSYTPQQSIALTSQTSPYTESKLALNLSRQPH